MSDPLLALAQRLQAAAAATGLAPAAHDDPAAAAAETLTALLETAATSPSNATAWLTLAALRGQMPTSDQVRDLRRALQLDPPDTVMVQLLDDLWHGTPAPELFMEADVVGGVVVYVDYCAHHDSQYGVPRVVRQLMSRWADRVVAVANSGSGWALRRLDAAEQARVHGRRPGLTVPATRLVIPWDGVVVAPDLPNSTFSARLAALGEHSGNRVTFIGYDMIPVVNADIRPIEDLNVFGMYLTAVKYATTVAAISAASREAFTGFTDSLAAQGLPGPAVVEVGLADDAPRPPAPHRHSQSRTVVCLGTHDHHKNHEAVLFAAQVLWAEGHRFTLELVGRPGWDSDDFMAQVARAQAQGLAVVERREVGDDDLWQILAAARFSVFVSLNEGFGLPAAESLACGTPVLTSAVGPMAEMGGGSLTVDPHDDQAIIDAMRRLLDDDDLVDDLAQEAARQPRRGWDDYADELWTALVGTDWTP